MPEQPKDDKGGVQADVLQKFARKHPYDAGAEVTAALSRAQASTEDESAQNGQGAGYSKRKHNTEKQRVVAFDVWLSDIHSETFRYLDVNGISASPGVIIIRLPWCSVVAEGRGMFLLREAVKQESVREIIAAANDTLQEWKIESIRIYPRETECSISDAGELSISEQPSG